MDGYFSFIQEPIGFNTVWCTQRKHSLGTNLTGIRGLAQRSGSMKPIKNYSTAGSGSRWRPKILLTLFYSFIVLWLTGCSNEQSEPPEIVVLDEQTILIEMTDEMKFMPETLTVSVGETLVWINRGSLPHTATDNPINAAVPEHNVLPVNATSWDSKALQQGESFKYIPTVPGNYTYSCTLHEANGMIGRLIVR